MSLPIVNKLGAITWVTILACKNKGGPLEIEARDPLNAYPIDFTIQQSPYANFLPFQTIPRFRMMWPHIILEIVW